MKKNYMTPELEVLSFNASDIVTESFDDGDTVVNAGVLFDENGEWLDEAKA